MIYLVIERGGMSAEDAWSHLIFATTSEELANNVCEASEADHKEASLSAQKIIKELEDNVRDEKCSKEEEDAYDAANVFLQTHDWVSTIVKGAPTETDIRDMSIYL